MEPPPVTVGRGDRTVRVLADVDPERAVDREELAAAEVELVWSPEWNVELVTDDGREALREFGVSV